MTQSEQAGAAEKTALLARLQAYVGGPAKPASVARDAVNQAMIRHWCDALGDHNPVYTDPAVAGRSVHGGIVAPPTMMHAWILPGLAPEPTEGDKLVELFGLLDAAGFTSVVAVNCEQEYTRYLRLGDVLSQSSAIEEVTAEKKTGLGTGHFVTYVTTFRDQQGAVVGTMRFRVLKFRPAARAAATAAAPAKVPRPRPTLSYDNEFYWSGVKRHELLIQRCVSCQQLRHPPRPMCPHCQSLQWDTVKASGRGTVHSFVVFHYPAFPGFEIPYVAAVIDLAEGTRVVTNLIKVDPQAVRVGMAVELEFVAVDDELTLPQFRPAAA
ncbi:MAG: bifunctional MaoC family dehydratase N-terminal/OB-fold nucleic acid binding domain-containing protein [Candidatus Binatia bacterium]